MLHGDERRERHGHGGCGHDWARTYLGSMAHSITGERPPTSFDQGLNRFTWLMIQFMAVMVPLVFLINGFTKHDWKAPSSSRWPWPWA